MNGYLPDGAYLVIPARPTIPPALRHFVRSTVIPAQAGIQNPGGGPAYR